jgi:hypothetical protein
MRQVETVSELRQQTVALERLARFGAFGGSDFTEVKTEAAFG